MAQNVFTGLSGSIGLLNANFTELYTLFGVLAPSGGIIVGTNDINVNKATPGLYLSATATGQGGNFYMRIGTSVRWAFGFDSGAEAGANAGSDYFLNSYSDAGAYLNTPLQVKRASGAVAMPVGADWTGGFSRLAVASSAATGRTLSAWNSANSAGSALAARVDFTACRLAEFFYNGGTSVGSITTNGTTSAYNTSSDARLKTNVVDAADFGAVIDAIQVRSFTWLSDGSACRAGFIAQELAQVAPEAVSVGDNNAEIESTWGVDATKLLPMLVAELQALRRRVAALEAVAA
jgi:hypothetical protein